MSIFTQVTDIMHEILEDTTNEASLKCGFVQRRRKLSGDAFVKTLVFGWFENTNASYTDLVHTARAIGIDVTRQAIAKRMTFEAAATFETAATQAISTLPQKLPLLNQFNGVYVQDSTTVSLPDELRPIWKGGRGKTIMKKLL